MTPRFDLRHVRAAALAALVSGATSALPAQSDGPDCAAAADRVRRLPLRADNLDDLRVCTESGPPALAAVWATKVPQDDNLRDALVGASGHLRDVRLYEAVVNAASSGRPTTDRLAALRVLTQYYDARLAPTVGFLTRSAVGDPISRSSHGVGLTGGRPLPNGVRSEFGELLARLAQADPDPVVRGAAVRLRQGIAYSDPANTPVAAGTVKLVAGCGPRVTVRSTSDIGLSLRVRVLGTDFDRTLHLRAPIDGRPVDHLLALPKGVVTVSHGPRELDRLTQRNLRCPSELTP
jgi:hypothetical protein